LRFAFEAFFFGRMKTYVLLLLAVLSILPLAGCESMKPADIRIRLMPKGDGDSLDGFQEAPRLHFPRLKLIGKETVAARQAERAAGKRQGFPPNACPARAGGLGGSAPESSGGRNGKAAGAVGARSPSSPGVEVGPARA